MIRLHIYQIKLKHYFYKFTGFKSKKKTIFKIKKKTKYINFTPDISHKDQLYQIIRYDNEVNDKLTIKDSFIDFNFYFFLN